MYSARFALLPLSLVLLVSASPIGRAAFSLQNGQDAQGLNAHFATLTADSSCNAGDNACVQGGFAQCVGGKFAVTGCAAGTSCFGLPLVNKPGTSIACTTQTDAEARIAATGATGGVDGNGGNGSSDNSGAGGGSSDDDSGSPDDNSGDDDTTPDPSSDGSTVTVVAGDTCIGIADAHGTTADALMAANPDINSECTNLEIGQTLTLPDDSSSGDGSGSNDTPPPTNDAPPPPANDQGGAPPAACENKSKRSLALTISKRIAQADLPAVAQSWQDLCLVSGGDIQTNDPCVKLAGEDGINALLAGADPCAQQDNADAMIDFANSPGVTNKDALIANAIAYRKHPRNALNINGIVPSTPFCRRAPRNPELNGLFNGQLDGVDPGLFGGPKFAIVPFGDPVSCPFGQSPDVDTCTCK